ncbi:MAG: Rieske (2Fe-2S) protein, partial [Guyparkeria sp.]
RHDFLETRDGERQLRCNVHQAYFRLDDGLCTAGPCEGQRLEPVDLKRIGDRIYLADRADRRDPAASSGTPADRGHLRGRTQP